MIEQWRAIPGYSRYEISSIGRVRKTTGEILSPHKKFIRGNKNNYYLAIKLIADAMEQNNSRHRHKHEIIHRLVLMAFIGMPEDGQVGCHRNDKKLDNSVSNLYWGTLKDNTQDAIRLGNFKHLKPRYGENHHACKYPDNVIRKILSEYTGAWGEQTRLAKKYNMRQTHVQKIVKGTIRSTAMVVN